MPELRVDSEDIKRFQANVRAHADGPAFRRELSRGLNSASKPIREQMKAKIPAALPTRGGLAAQMQSQVSSTTSSARGGISIRFRSKGYDIRTLTGKRLRHPVFGNRSVWVEQSAGLNPEAFTGEFDKQAPEVKRSVERVIDDIARKVLP